LTLVTGGAGYIGSVGVDEFRGGTPPNPSFGCGRSNQPPFDPAACDECECTRHFFEFLAPATVCLSSGANPCFTKGLMTHWPSEELEKIAAADELQLASARPDGRLRKPVTIWVVRLGDDVYVRSVNGRTSHWFRSTEDRHEGHIRAGGVDKDVRFVEAGDDVNDEIEAAYRTKYGHYGASYVDPLFTPGAKAATLELVPR
jgi:hypothetical protein